MGNIIPKSWVYHMNQFWMVIAHVQNACVPLYFQTHQFHKSLCSQPSARKINRARRTTSVNYKGGNSIKPSHNSSYFPIPLCLYIGVSQINKGSNWNGHLKVWKTMIHPGVFSMLQSSYIYILYEIPYIPTIYEFPIENNWITSTTYIPIKSTYWNHYWTYMAVCQNQLYPFFVHIKIAGIYGCSFW
jgi:hypothetical protein